MRRWQQAGGRIEQSAAFGASELALLDALGKFSPQAPVERPQRRLVPLFFLKRQDQQVGPDRLYADVSESDLHELLTQAFCRISVMNSLRVSWRVRKAPSNVLVMIIEFCFSTPRILMHKCSASMTTATPRGSSFSMMILAIWLVSRSWTWSRRA